jgi:hypothetical protein
MDQKLNLTEDIKYKLILGMTALNLLLFITGFISGIYFMINITDQVFYFNSIFTIILMKIIIFIQVYNKDSEKDAKRTEDWLKQKVQTAVQEKADVTMIHNELEQIYARDVRKIIVDFNTIVLHFVTEISLSAILYLLFRRIN